MLILGKQFYTSLIIENWSQVLTTGVQIAQALLLDSAEASTNLFIK